VRSVDPVTGQAGVAESQRFTVDTTKPAAPTVSVSPMVDGVTSAAPWFDFGSTEPGLSYLCDLGGGFKPCKAGRTFPLDAQGQPTLADGEHTLTVKAVDRAGNVSDASAAFAFQADAVFPTVEVTSPASDVTENPAVTVGFRVVPAAGQPSGEPAVFGCRVDDRPFRTCGKTDAAGTPIASPTGEVSVDFSGQPDALHTIQIRAQDVHGNIGPTITKRISVDTTGPTVVVTQPAADGEATGPATSLAWRVEPASTNAVEQLTFECTLRKGGVDGAVIQSGPCGADRPSQAYTGLTSGTHTVQVRGIDDLGNRGPIASRRITVDATGPVVTIDEPAAQVGTAAAFRWHADEPLSAASCWLDGQPVRDCSSPFVLGGLTAGSHLFEVQGTDGFGNVGAKAARAFTVTAPAAPPANGGGGGAAAPAQPAGGGGGAAPPAQRANGGGGGAQQAARLEALAVATRLNLGTVERRGLTLTLDPAPGTRVVRVQLFQILPKRAGGRGAVAAAAAVRRPTTTRRKLVATAYVRITSDGRQRITIPRRVLRRLKAGRYRLEARAGVDRHRLSTPVGRRLTIRR
jgi:hypothetical protein